MRWVAGRASRMPSGRKEGGESSKKCDGLKKKAEEQKGGLGPDWGWRGNRRGSEAKEGNKRNVCLSRHGGETALEGRRNLGGSIRRGRGSAAIWGDKAASSSEGGRGWAGGGANIRAGATVIKTARMSPLENEGSVGEICRG